ncbi:MAG: hypothetical protein HXS54_01465 [Theionarchaea archaeon]|nr:hypothetical protein [Theionarchaea archaeon]
MVKYYPKNFIPVNGGGESLMHFILRCLFCKAVYEKNREYRTRVGELLVESEKMFFEKMKHRGDVYDPKTRVLYEIQKNSEEIRTKKGIFYRSKDIEFIKFINPEGFSSSEEFQELLESIWKEIQKCVIIE